MTLWSIVLLPSLASLFTAVNMVTWRSPAPRLPPKRVSICIPARNEVGSIEACVRSIPAEQVYEILVLDDGSTDGTTEVLDRLAKEIEPLTVIQGHGLPAGWVGKPHACHVLSTHATGDTLVFIDADVELHDDGLARIGALLDSGAHVITAVPNQVTVTAAEQFMMPMLMVTYVSWLPLALIPKTRNPLILAANGQILAMARETYDRVGGFEAVKADVVDDMAICARAKQTNHRVVFADGSDIADCRMYSTPSEIWSGFSKNMYEGLGANPLLLLLTCTLYLGAFVLPWVTLCLSFWAPSFLLPSLVGIALPLLCRGALALRFRQRLWSVVLHPLATLGFIAIALNSARWHYRGQIEWAGRVYAARHKRGSNG